MYAYEYMRERRERESESGGREGGRERINKVHIDGDVAGGGHQCSIPVNDISI